MSKKILALLLSLMMILSQSTLCFGEVLAGDEGADPVLESIVAKPETLNVPPYADNALLETFVANNIKVTAAYDDQSTGTIEKTDFTVAVAENTATVTYNEKTATVALSQSAVTTEPIVLDFESDMGGMTAKDWNAGNVLALSLEDGALKCDYTYTEGERSYLYLPLDNVDGAYYDTIKVKAKVENVEGTPGNFVMYYAGSDKTNADYTGESSDTRKSFAYANTTESDGLSSNSEYQEYIIDLTDNAHWKGLYVSKIRIDGLHNKSGIVYIDSIELYNKASQIVPSTEPIVWDFESNMTGVTVKNWNSNVLTASLENGALKCDYSYESGERSYLFFALPNIDGEYYNTLKIRAKVVGLAMANNFARMYYDGTDKVTGDTYSADSARTKSFSYTGLTESEGIWSNADYVDYEIDLSSINKWSDSTITRIRIDGLNNTSAVIYFDSVEIYHKEAAPELTGIEVAPSTLSVPYANQDNVLDFVKGAITGVTATYSDGSSALVTGYEVAINGEVATVTYEGMTDTIALTLEDASVVTPTLTGIEVAPSTLSVPYANQADIIGFVRGAITGVTATYSDGSSALVTGYEVAINGEVATVTYEGLTDTIALILEEEPQAGAPIVWDFESNMTGVTVKNWNSNVLTASLENGALKCDYLYESGERSYLFFALPNIDGEYYNTLKIRAKIASLPAASNFARLYFTGVDKVTGDTYGATSTRYRSFSYTGLTENNGVYSNADYVDYIVDLTTMPDWTKSTVSQLRIDGINNATAILYIDSLEIYHKELTGITVAPSAMEVPLSQQATAADYVKSHITSVIAVYSDGSEVEAEDYTVTVEDNTATVTYMDKTATIALTFVEEVVPPAPDDEVAEGEEFILYDFNEGTENFVKHGDIEISQIVTDDGITALEYISSVDTAAGKTETGYITKNVNLNPGQVYKIEMRVKFVGVTPVFGSGTTPAYNVIYAGSIDGKEFVGDSHHQIVGTYSDIELTEGEYWSKDGDWHIVTIDPTKANGTKTKSDGTVVEVNWGKSIIEQIRFDILKKSNGIVLVDYIKMYSVPSVTDIVFDNGGISASAVPVGTEKITLTLSDSLYEVKKNAVSVVSADGVSVEVKGVSHEKSTNKVVITIGELDSMTDYAVLINSNALANERQSLYKAIKATFTTEKGVLECNAAGDGSSAEFTFVNAGESKNVVLVATVWDGDKYVGKYTQPYQIAAGDSTYTFNYSSVTGGDRAEVAVWEYADGAVKAVYGKKVFTFER